MRDPAQTGICDAYVRECDGEAGPRPGTIEPLIGMRYARLREVHSTPDYFWDSWRRGGAEFVVVQRTISGAGIYEDETGRHSVPPGSAFVSVVPERARYFYAEEATEPWTFSWINFNGSLAAVLWRRLQATFGPVISLPDRSPATLAMNQLISRQTARGFRDRFEASAAAYAFYLECWNGLMHGAPDPETRLKLVLKHCRDHLREGLTIKEVAAYAEMSREHFTREFRRLFGVPPATYLRDQRLEEAASLLTHTHLTLREIAERTGFATPRQFGDTFRRCRGMSPQAYRASRKTFPQ